MNMNIYIPLNYPKGSYLIKPVKDLKDDNLIFHISADEGFFEEGTILKNIKIFDEETEKIINKAKISFCEKQTNEEFRHSWYKIGIDFLEYEKDFSKRPTRVKKELIDNLKTKIFFKLNDNDYRAELLNFSKFGASLFIKSPKFVLTKGEVLKSLKIEVDGKTFYEGEGTVVQIKNIELDIEVGISFKNGNIPVEEITKLSTNQRIDFVYNEIIQNFEIENKISPEFKAKVNEFRYYLDVLKLKLDTFEEQLKQYPQEEKYNIGYNLLEKLRIEKFKDIDKMLLEMDKLVERLNLSTEDFEIYKKYYQNVLHPLILKVPFINRVYNKPLGYAGDYEMMNMIYKDTYDGETLFEKLINKHSNSLIPSQFNRNRVPYLMNKIKNVVLENKNSQERVKITSVACGPAIEIQEFMKDDLSDYCDFTLLDVSGEALSYSKDKLLKLKEKYNRKTNFKFIQESVYDLLKKEKSRDRIENNQNMIYSSGLFEYLLEGTCKKLMDVLFDKVKKKGTLIIGNYPINANFKVHMELGGEWFLFYRDENILKNLVSKIESDNISIENSGVLFLNISK